MFFKRFVDEYLPTISKWFNFVKLLKLGDVVAITTNNSPKLFVKFIITTEDGGVQKIEVKTVVGDLHQNLLFSLVMS